MLGNEMQKGNCCGGYNSNNEDYVWELFRQAYPKHKVVAVTPYSTTQTESYNGIVNGGLAILFGNFCLNNDVTIALEMINMDGMITRIKLLSSDPFQTQQPSAACVVNMTEGNSPSGWQFIGWQVQLTGPVISSGGLEVDFMAMIGGSYPLAAALPAECNLTPLSAIYSQVDNVITLPAGVDTLTVQLEIDRLQLGATGVYETYSVAEIQNMFNAPDATVTVTAVTNATPTTQLVTLTLSSLTTLTTNCYWLKDVAVKFTSAGVDYNLQMNGLTVKSLEVEEVVSVVTIDGAVDASTEGYISGLSFVRGRNLTFDVENDSAVDSDITISRFGGPATFAAVAVPGASNPTHDFDVAPYLGTFYEVPTMEVAIGTPA